jgi:protoporphyrinogen oxidase
LYKIITKKQKENVIKTLIDKFDYPRLGPGMMWEEATKKINQNGGSVLMDSKVEIINLDLVQKKVISCETISSNKTTNLYSGENYISTLPIKNLINSFNPKPPEEIIQSANSLKYRDFLTVVLILNKKISG